jgi:hypothetical protein
MLIVESGSDKPNRLRRDHPFHGTYLIERILIGHNHVLVSSSQIVLCILNYMWGALLPAILGQPSPSQPRHVIISPVVFLPTIRERGAHTWRVSLLRRDSFGPHELMIMNQLDYESNTRHPETSSSLIGR